MIRTNNDSKFQYGGVVAAPIVKEIKLTTNYKINYLGNGDKVVSQIPSPNERVAEGENIYLYLN